MTLDVLGAIKTHAEKTGYSVAQLFEQAGHDPSNWSRWKNGTHDPQMRVVKNLLAVPDNPDHLEEQAAQTWEELRALAERREYRNPSAWASRKWEQRNAANVGGAA